MQCRGENERNFYQWGNVALGAPAIVPATDTGTALLVGINTAAAHYHLQQMFEGLNIHAYPYLLYGINNVALHTVLAGGVHGVVGV